MTSSTTYESVATLATVRNEKSDSTIVRSQPTWLLALRAASEEQTSTIVSTPGDASEVLPLNGAIPFSLLKLAHEGMEF